MLAAVSACSSSSPHSVSPAANPTSAAASTPTSTSAAGAAALARFYRQSLRWHGCATGFECAELLVPVDYAHPDAATMKIAVTRMRSTGSHRGSLIVNPGGPGASGVDFVHNAAHTFAGVTTHFDLVSFDPRGVGGSRPIRCVTPKQLDAFIHVDPNPDTSAEHSALVATSKQFADDCWARNGSYLEHIGTIDAARDMDVLRAVLGDRTLTYYGASYGTYLGAKYAQLFPTRIRAMVLDGALDPAQPTSAENRVQALGFETNLHDFLADCARETGCPFGSTPAQVQQGLDQLAARIDAHPIPVGARSLGPGEFFEGLALGLYSPTYWAYLRQALNDAKNGDGSFLLQFSDLLTERRTDGTYSNLIESLNAINCIDRPSSRSVASYDTDAHAFAKVAPHFGAAIAYGSLPCAFWHVPPVEAAHAVRAPGSPPIVVIGTTRDPATPYVWAQALARELARGVLVTFNGNGHTAYDRGNPCVTAAVNGYLDELKVPRAGLRCG